MERRGLRFDRMVAAGGGAKSRLWLEIKASMYDRPILVPSEPECGVVGCGRLAGCASGLFSSLVTTISEQVRYDGEIHPNPAWTERYKKMQLLFDDLYESSERFWIGSRASVEGVASCQSGKDCQSGKEKESIARRTRRSQGFGVSRPLEGDFPY